MEKDVRVILQYVRLIFHISKTFADTHWHKENFWLRDVVAIIILHAVFLEGKHTINISICY